MAVGIAFGIGFLILAGLGVRAMGDPYPALFGVRVADGRIAVKVPLCAGSELVSVRVKDYDGRETLWTASGPLTPEGRRGEFTVWESAEFGEAGGGQQPAGLPTALEVTVTVAGGESGPYETTATVWTAKAEVVPAGAYAAREGIQTAPEIDAQATGCGANGGG